MNAYSVILGRIVIPQQPGADAAEALLERAAAEDGEWQIGRILQARVAALLANGKLLLELDGQRLQVDGIRGLTVGQTFMVRIGEADGGLLLEMLAGKTQPEQHVLTALKSLFSGNEGGVRLWLQLAADLQRIADVGRPDRPAVPPELTEAVKRQLTPVRIGESPVELSKEIREFVQRLGFDLESNLRAAVRSGVVRQDVEQSLKPLLGRLIIALRQAAQVEEGVRPAAVEAPPSAATAQAPLPAATVDRILALLQRHIDRITSEAPTRDTQQRAALVLETARTSAQALARGGAEQLDHLRALLSVVRPVPAVVESQQDKGPAEMGRLAGELEAILRSSKEGGHLLERLAVTDALRTAEAVQERVESFQVLNAHLGDRSQLAHLFIPMHFFDELTEVQIKQFVEDRRNGGGKSHTIVMLLQLESLGAVRIDALAQDRTLYVSVFVEREELAPVVVSMAEEFASQLSARGFNLGKLVCRCDRRTINDFHTIQGDVLTDREGLIDVKI